MNQKTKLSEPSGQNPLVATLAMTPAAQLYFNQLRQQHFPKDRNYIDAHLTLFHALPNQSGIVEDLKELAKTQQPFEATARTIVSLGNGTAIKIESTYLSMLHQKLQKSWFDLLTNQDRQKRNFHITIQNKVEAHNAKKLQSEIAQDFKPFQFTIEGIQLWRYMGGPWEFQQIFKFGNEPTLNQI